MPFYEFAENSDYYHQNLICSANSCKKGITQKQAAVMCGYCQKLFHPPCKGIIGAAKIKKAAELNWVCSPDCVKASSSAHDPTDTPSTSTAKASDIKFEAAINSLMTRIDTQFAEVKLLISDIQKSQEFICNEFDVLKIESKNIAAENAFLKEKCKSITQNYLKQDERVNILEAQLDVIAQKEIENNIVIGSLPADVRDIHNFIVDTIRSVNGAAEITAIKKMHHNPNSKSMLRDSFIVTLNSVEIKNDILTKFKMHHRTTSTSKQSRCYVIQHFTKFQSKLYNEAKKMQRTHSYKYLWAKNGKIFLRKTAESEIHHIFSFNDIFRLDKRSTSHHDSPNGTTSNKET